MAHAMPPGPRNVLLNTLRFMRDPYGTLRRCAAEHGGTFSFPSLLGPAVVTGDPAAIREVFAADPDIFEPPLEFLEVLAAPNSMLLLQGARHKRERKLMMPPFHGARMRAYGKTMRDVALRCAAPWRRGQRFTMLPVMQKLTEEVIIRTVFGVEEPERIRVHQQVIEAVARAFSPSVAYLPFLRHGFGGHGPWSRFLRAVARHNDLLRDEVDERRRDPTERQDILSLLLAARDEEGQPMADADLRDELRTLLAAGHETTATTLAWAFYEVHRNPTVLSRLRAEIEPLGRDPDPEDLVRLPLLGAVCDETLRLHPIAPTVMRRLKQPFQLLGYELPAGTLLQPAMAITHFREDLYPAPDAFRPERHLERQFTPFELLAFGGGTRRCLGAAFALYEMKIVLGTLLSRFRLSLASSAPVKAEWHGITIAPEGGVEMIFVDEISASPGGAEAAA
jgi:cytochrome P450 family 110